MSRFVNVLKITDAEVELLRNATTIKAWDVAVNAIYKVRGGKKYMPVRSWRIRVEQAPWFEAQCEQHNAELRKIVAANNARMRAKEAAAGITIPAEELARWARIEEEFEREMTELKAALALEPRELEVDPDPTNPFERVDISKPGEIGKIKIYVK